MSTSVETASVDVPTSPRAGLRLAVMLGIALVAAAAVLAYGINPEFGSRAFWKIVDLRTTTVLTIVVVAACQGVATVVFQTATSNRILTPSIMGFEAMYVLMQTSMVFFYGAQTVASTDGVAKVLLQSALMVASATALYAWLFSGRRGNLHITLLVGIVFGIAFGSASTFMQRLLTPAEFDILSARLFGNIANSNVGYLPWAAVIVGLCFVVLWRRRHRLDVLALGRDQATSLGLNYTREVLVVLVLTATLISVSTTMVGPLTFFGFIVATVTYQLAGTTRHAVLMPFSFILGVAVLLVGYFVLHHLLGHVGLLTVVIEFGGGLFFLIYLLRKGAM